MKNILRKLPDASAAEVFQTLIDREDLKLERIISEGQASPEGQWIKEDLNEWVLVLQGRARLLFEGETAKREMGPGDYLLIPAGTAHRVEWTDPDTPTIWLALHY